MMLYGFFVSAPLSHVLVSALQKAFHGKKGFGWKLAQIAGSNLLVLPIQNLAFLLSMSVIAGARSLSQIAASVKVGFIPVMRVSWVTSPIILALAQAFVPELAWVPFFSLFAFFIATYNNVIVKKKRLAAEKKLQEEQEKKE